VTSLRTLSNFSYFLWHKELLDVQYSRIEWLDVANNCTKQCLFRWLSQSWEQSGPAYLYLSVNELCTGAAMRVPTERAVHATSGTRAIVSPSLPLVIMTIGGINPKGQLKTDSFEMLKKFLWQTSNNKVYT